jgi:hypothetical protein
MPTASAEYFNKIVQYVGATNANYINGYFYKCVSDGGVTPAYSWEKIQVSDGGDTIQVDELPTASADELGNIYEFVGTTTANYINGRFYRCVSDGASTPTYTWEEVDLGDGTPHWSGTRAEYEAVKSTLEDGTYVAITDDYEETLYQGSYSTTEVKTSDTWIDGKPIYRKCFVVTIRSDGTGVTNADYMYADVSTGTYRGFKGKLDFATTASLSLDTLVSVKGVIKLANHQQWNITPGIGQDEVISPSATTYILQRGGNIYVSLDDYIRFWIKDPQTIYNDSSNPATYNVFAVIEYTKTTD